MALGRLGGGLGRLGSSGGGAALPSIYEGFVATRGIVPTVLNSSLPYWNSRSGHYSRSPITQLRIAIPNWYVNAGVETGTGQTQSYTAAVEYPAGVFTQIKFGGSATGSTASNTTLLSDLTTVNIPTNTLFWIRIFGNNNTGGFTFLSTSVTGATLSSTAMGDKLEFSATSIADKTMGGTIADSPTNIAVRPLAITGPTRAPSVLIWGDSIAAAISDQVTSIGDGGIIGRWIGPNFGYANMAVAGDTCQLFVTGNNGVKRRALLSNCTHVFCEYGNNDLWQSCRTAAQLAADWQTAWAFAKSLGKKVYQTPIHMRTTGTWATVGGQTITTAPCAGNGPRGTINGNLRGGVYAGLIDGYYEVVYMLESANDSGFWAAPPQITDDGVHPNFTGFGLVQTVNQPLALAGITR